jgi:hypothetical protein
MKLSEVRDIAFFASAIPSHKAMGFKTDSDINSIAEEAKELIEYHIGEGLQENYDKVEVRLSVIKEPFLSELRESSEGKDDEEVKVIETEINKRLNEAIFTDVELTALSDDEKKLWDKAIKDSLSTIEIENKEYAEKFSEPKKVALFRRELTVDGYMALLQLISKKIITIKD